MTTIADYVKLVNRYMDEDLTDGLPVIPPYRELIAEMVEASGLPANHVLGIVPPRNVELTVETAAINAVMAGCLPEYMPVVIAMLEAVLEKEFNLVWPSTTTKGVAIMVIVNGPIRKKIKLNCQGNVFGPGFRANATIGRTLRLIINNVGGAKSQILDKSVFGHMGKYTYVIGEDEENSPFTPLHVDRGFKPEDSTVTVLALDAPKMVVDFSPAGETVLRAIADVASPLVNVGFGGKDGEMVVLLGPEHRATLVAEGWTKEQIRQFLFEHIGRKVSDFKAAKRNLPFTKGDDEFIRAYKSPEYINIVCAGGGAGRISAVCDGSVPEKFTKSQTKKIRI
ncbi:MAG: hypothetical protein GX197_08175 [Firmicutes bacterium]|mgnify:CR=1 FL=1|nr:hypothetical protein [Bacillota bacterium]